MTAKKTNKPKKPAGGQRKATGIKKSFVKKIKEPVFITAGGLIGRPRYYRSVNEFNEKANEYFESIGNDKPSSYGIALYMGFESRQSLYDYEKRPAFSYSVHVIQTFIKRSWELKLHEDRPQGAIFALSTLGWTVKTEVDNFNHDITVEI